MDRNEQDRFAAELTHQLKTPMSVLQTAAVNLRRNLRALLVDLSGLGEPSDAVSVAGFLARAVEQQCVRPMTGPLPADRIDRVICRLRQEGVDGDLNGAASGLVRGGWEAHMNEIAAWLGGDPGLILEILETTARLKTNVAAIESAVERIDRLSIALGALSGPLPLDSIDLGTALRETVDQLRETFPEQVRIDLSLGDLPPVRASRELLGEVWSNLAVNAAQAMRHTGVLRIEAVSHNGGVSVRFIDEGPGISPELLERVFEPYFTTRGAEGGSGLGLALVRRIVNRLGGRVEASSGPGRTCFTVTLASAEAGLEGA